MVRECFAAFRDGATIGCQIMVVDISAEQLPFRDGEACLVVLAKEEQTVVCVGFGCLDISAVSLGKDAEGSVRFVVECFPLFAVVGGLQRPSFRVA